MFKFQLLILFIISTLASAKELKFKVAYPFVDYEQAYQVSEVLGMSNRLADSQNYRTVEVTFDTEWDKSCELSLAHFTKALRYWGEILRNSKNDRSVMEVLSKIKEFFASDNPQSCKQFGLEYLSVVSAIFVYGPGKSAEQVQSFANILSYVQQKGMIKPLTAKVREDHKVLRNNNILGAYYCAEETIWLSVDQPPFNIGSVLIHELEHWARSKALAYFQDLDDLKKLTGRQYHILDEVLSSLHPALLQVKLSYDANRSKDTTVRDFVLTFDGETSLLGRPLNQIKRRSFKSNYDFNLYSKGGHLINIWKTNVKEVGVKKSISVDSFIEKHMLRDSKKVVKHRKKIFKLVEKIYFGSSTGASSEALKFLEKKFDKLKSFFSPLEWIIQENDPSLYSFKSKCEPDIPISPGRGGEGAGLHDGDLKMSKKGIKACLKPLKKL